MPGLLSPTWRLGVWMAAVLVVAMAMVVQGVSHHPLSLNSRLNMMLDHVDASIWDKKQRLGGGQNYAPDEKNVVAREVTQVVSMVCRRGGPLGATHFALTGLRHVRL
ncbi:hypothetical protein E2C01_039077 [Portunus trituberculatus]|uniref:Uncharacterized protein n=1 Tax=Portunus trituberculatus TaxID=210409 RepID=A0A5B7FJP2_PORTR|nr:hypothetical protein [Portunus trituberculatus]